MSFKTKKLGQNLQMLNEGLNLYAKVQQSLSE